MTIKELRILPPLAIGRLGSADEPMDNYTLADPDPSEPLGYRKIVPAATLKVNKNRGDIESDRPSASIVFKTGRKIRPVAPFLQVFAVTEDGELQPLVSADVKKVTWKVWVANHKVFRRTSDKKDQVEASVEFDDHGVHPLLGHCTNFVEGKTLSFGEVRFIKPNTAFPEIRLRFTPAKGLIYGPTDSSTPSDPAADSSLDDEEEEQDAKEKEYKVPRHRRIYDAKKGTWDGFDASKWGESKGPAAGDKEKREHADKAAEAFYNETVPPSLFAIYPPAPSWLYDNKAVSRGYLDDACDGFVEVHVVLKGGKQFDATARIVAAPPALAPDSLFVRSLADDLEQVVKGPFVGDGDLQKARDGALDIIRRAFETVRFMNVAVMNGNDFKGRPALSLDSMPEEEAADTERAIRPIMGPGTVDTFAAMTLHQQAYAAIQSGAAPWFVRLLRRPDEAADYTDRGRRKMPALMCGADNNYLALTWRQIDTIKRAAEGTLPKPGFATPSPPKPRNNTAKLAAERLAQINYEVVGNPINSRPISSVANCCPGLEVDFRAVWRRMFRGIVLREYDNLVVTTESDNEAIRHLKGRRLLRVYPAGDPEGILMMTQIKGPASSDPEGYIVETTDKNPSGLAALEWSNALAKVLMHQGEEVQCDFSKAESWDLQQPWKKDNHIRIPLRVRHFFEKDTAVIDRALAKAGELTQGLCSPWQNDYRECSCYYWASARPDYVNTDLGEDGLSKGDNWMQKERTGSYVADDYADTRLLMYDELFRHWERVLKFQVGGRDVEDAE